MIYASFRQAEKQIFPSREVKMQKLRFVALFVLLLNGILYLGAQSDPALSGYVYYCRELYGGSRAARSVYLCLDRSVIVISDYEADAGFLFPGHFITKLDAGGEFMWESTLPGYSNSTVAMVDVDAEGGIYFLCADPDAIQLYRLSLSGREPIGGPIVPPCNTYFSKALRTDGGDIVAVGQSRAADGDEWAACYYRFSAQGDSLASAYWPGSSGAGAYDLALLDSGNLLVSCYLSGNSQSVLEVNPAGEIVSTYDVSMSLFGFGISISAESGAQTHLLAYKSSGGVSVARFAGGSSEHLFTVPGSVIEDVNSLVVTQDNIFLCGIRGLSEGVVVKLDADGAVEWARYQRGDNATICQDWTPASKSLLAVDDNGCAYWSWGGHAPQVIIKLPPDGQVHTVDEVQIPAANMLTVWPNPMKTRLSIKADPSLRGESVEVYNIRGELVRRLKMTDSEAIWDGRNSSGVDCPSGVYLLRSNDVRNRVKKISKIN